MKTCDERAIFEHAGLAARPDVHGSGERECVFEAPDRGRRGGGQHGAASARPVQNALAAPGVPAAPGSPGAPGLSFSTSTGSPAFAAPGSGRFSFTGSTRTSLRRSERISSRDDRLAVLPVPVPEVEDLDMPLTVGSVYLAPLMLPADVPADAGTPLEVDEVFDPEA